MEADMRRFTAVLAVLAVMACADRDTVGIGAYQAGIGMAGPGELTVLNWNVYYGADLGMLVREDIHPLLPVRAALVFSQVMSTDAAGRADAIARRIVEERPHLVSLQEVAHYRIQMPGDFLGPTGAVQNPYPNATHTVFDFLELVMQSLASHGAEYVVASRATTLDAELPMVRSDYSCCDDLRLTESVAILARTDVVWSNPQQHLFTVNMPVGVGGMTLHMVKGWASVDATLKGRTYRFVTTHLEPADIEEDHGINEDVHWIQQMQAGQLLDWLAGTSLPVILTGDLNSEPFGASTATWGMMRDAGFVDTWLRANPDDPGFTAGQDADLRNAESKLRHRIDYVLYRDEFTARGGPLRGDIATWRVGHQPAHRTASGLWPSDHAGVAAVFNTSQKPVPKP
jgi:endonuclease/exonuclease/phosphatase family metal-dependent hydrolase